MFRTGVNLAQNRDRQILFLVKYGKEMTWDIKAGCMGKPEYEFTANLLLHFPDVPLTIPEYLAQRNLIQNKLLPTVPLLSGVRKLISHFKVYNIPMAVATSSRRSTFELETRHLGEGFDCFEGRVVCGDVDLKQWGMLGKPESDMILVAARELLGARRGPVEGVVTPAQVAETRKGACVRGFDTRHTASKRAGMSGRLYFNVV
ncbi:putative hydrolase [Mycena venus]|uniref:Putative hydrolase n=1 Tax=Mycena venus TaxID=2733690 RepID=A0A8H6YET8_9AGAR|nr:putative hydrolase [Mycena venus]